jgi:hypothetical protein
MSYRDVSVNRATYARVKAYAVEHGMTMAEVLRKACGFEPEHARSCSRCGKPGHNRRKCAR